MRVCRGGGGAGRGGTGSEDSGIAEYWWGEEQDTHREVLASFLLSRAMANGPVYFVTEAKGFV